MSYLGDVTTANGLTFRIPVADFGEPDPPDAPTRRQLDWFIEAVELCSFDWRRVPLGPTVRWVDRAELARHGGVITPDGTRTAPATPFVGNAFAGSGDLTVGEAEQGDWRTADMFVYVLDTLDFAPGPMNPEQAGGKLVYNDAVIRALGQALTIVWAGGTPFQRDRLERAFVVPDFVERTEYQLMTTWWRRSGAGSYTTADAEVTTLPWDLRITEAIAEQFKDAFLDRKHRQFENRTAGVKRRRGVTFTEVVSAFQVQVPAVIDATGRETTGVEHGFWCLDGGDLPEGGELWNFYRQADVYLLIPPVPGATHVELEGRPWTWPSAPDTRAHTPTPDGMAPAHLHQTVVVAWVDGAVQTQRPGEEFFWADAIGKTIALPLGADDVQVTYIGQWTFGTLCWAKEVNAVALAIMDARASKRELAYGETWGKWFVNKPSGGMPRELGEGEVRITAAANGRRRHRAVTGRAVGELQLTSQATGAPAFDVPYVRAFDYQH